MKATAETIMEAAASKLLDVYEEDGRSLQLVDAVIGTLPLTLEQLAGIANGELVVAHKDDLIIPAALRGDPDRVSKAHAAWIAKGKWVLVPKEPTAEMFDAGQAANDAWDKATQYYRKTTHRELDIWFAMLAASPEKDKTT